MIKLRGCLGGHWVNIGMRKVMPSIGAVGQKWTKLGIGIACQAFKEGIPLLFH